MRSRLRWPLVVVAAVAALSDCDCTNEVGLPPTTPECTTNLDCSFNQVCTAGVCEGGLPSDEGEGDLAVEGEGDLAVEGEGDVDTGFVIAPTTLTLPSAAIGSSSTGSAQIVNTGDVAITLSDIRSSNVAFVVTAPSVGSVVGVDGSLSLDLRFSPTAAGAASSTITITAGGGSRTLTVTSSAAQAIEDGALQFSAGPDDAGLGLDGCICKASVSPANVDIAYASGASTCRKPSSIACGVNDSCVPCNLGAQGEARWRSGRTEQARDGDAPWIVDEEIVHQGAGADGDFVLSATLQDDCTAALGSIGRATNETCCGFIDCGAGNANACYPYSEPVSCVTDCSAFVAVATNDGECMARGPVLVRARVTLDGDERDFCVTMTQGQTVEVARVRRTAGAFAITSVGAVTEVAAGGACP